jgi:NarL family two-component system response regulator LiaR
MAEGEPIRVMVVDDHDMVRRGLAVFLDTFDDLELVGEAANGREAVEVCAACHPEVVLMDLVMPGDLDGVAAIGAIRREHPPVQILALTSYQEQERVQAALRAGAIGYVLKNASIEALAEAVRQAYAGKPTLSPEVTQALIDATTRDRRAEFALTERETQVLRLLVDGMTNRQIASSLTLSQSTVKFYVSSVLSKLRASSRTEAVSIALQNGLVD